MVAVRASRSSNSSHSKNRNSGERQSGNSHPRDNFNYYGRSSDASQSSGNAFSKYGPSQSKGSRTQKNFSGIQEIDKNLLNNRNSGFEKGDPSVLDRYNYASNSSHLFSTGSGQKQNLPQANPVFGNSGLKNNFSNISAMPAPPAVFFQAGQGASSDALQGSRGFGSGHMFGNQVWENTNFPVFPQPVLPLFTQLPPNPLPVSGTPFLPPLPPGPPPQKSRFSAKNTNGTIFSNMSSSNSTFPPALSSSTPVSRHEHRQHRLDRLRMENVRDAMGYNTQSRDVPPNMSPNSSPVSRGLGASTTKVDDQSLLGDLARKQLIKLVGLL